MPTDKMEDYSDRIGEPVRGLQWGGEDERIGYYMGRCNEFHVLTPFKKEVGKIPDTTGDHEHYFYLNIEFLIPQVFRHYGKRAKIGDKERTLIFTYPNGHCCFLGCGCTIKRFERDVNFAFLHGDTSYELIKEPTYTLTKDGKPVDLTPEQIRKIEEVLG